MREMITPSESPDLAFWKSRLESHQWSGAELDAYAAGRLAGRLEQALALSTSHQRKAPRTFFRDGIVKGDLYAQGYEAGCTDTRAGSRVTHCARCERYTTDELATLQRTTITVGPFSVASTGKVTPDAFNQGLTGRERELLVVMLRAMPLPASWASLRQACGWDMETTKHNVRVIASRMRAKLAPYGWSCRPYHGMGYGLVEEPSADPNPLVAS